MPPPTPSTVSRTTLDTYNQLGPWEAADASYELLALVDSIGSQQDVTEQYTRDTATHVGWGVLLDVINCPSIALPWLAQFVGVRIPLGATDAQIRALIQTSGANTRGTPAAIIALIRGILGNTARIDIYERYTGDAYQLKITTYLHDTPGGAGGATAAAVLAAILTTKPAGIILTYSVQSGPDWEQMSDWPAGHINATWAQQTDTWASLSNDVPVIP